MRNAKETNSTATSEPKNSPGVTADTVMTTLPNITTATPPSPAINRQSLRYRVTIEVKPDKQKTPLAVFAANFKVVLSAIQNVAGEHLWLGPWDEEQELSGFPVIKTTDDLPDGLKPDRHRNIFNIYTNSYVNPKKEGSKIWLQLRFVHEKAILVELRKLGDSLQDTFIDLPFDVRFYRQPNHCQAASVECIGWLYGSTKTISEIGFTDACRVALGIPDKVAFGIQWRTITDRLGKRPPFDQDNPPPSALHLDIDRRFAHSIQKKAGGLWRKYDKQKHRPPLPHDIQLRLVPCFSSEFSDARKTPKTEENVVLMAGKQKFFATQYIEKIEVHFIRFLDTPLSPTNDITLRRAIMARSPKGEPTKRLIHNVDFFWNDAHRVAATTIKTFRGQAQDFISTLLPEMVFRYGQECQKWFAEDGLTYFDNVTWDPQTFSTTSESDSTTQALVDEDLWDLGDDWKSVAIIPRQAPTKVGTSIIKQKINKNKNKVTTRQLENDDDIRSFASAFGAEPMSESSPTGEDTGQTNAGATVKLTSTVLDQLNTKTPNTHNDNLSMSTAAKTTESTRIRLHEAKSTITQQTSMLNSQAMELERLRLLLQAQNQDEATPMELQSVEVEVDTHLLVSTAQLPSVATTEIIPDPDHTQMSQEMEDIDEQSILSAPSTTSATTSPKNDQVDARYIPLPDSPPRVVDLQSPSGSINSIDNNSLIDRPTPIGAVFGGSRGSNRREDHGVLGQDKHMITDLRSKFSAAKFSSAGTRASGKSPPKKVRFTSSNEDADNPSDATSDDESSSVGYQAHTPTTDPKAIVDLVDDGSRA